MQITHAKFFFAMWKVGGFYHPRNQNGWGLFYGEPTPGIAPPRLSSEGASAASDLRAILMNESGKQVRQLVLTDEVLIFADIVISNQPGERPSPSTLWSQPRRRSAIASCYVLAATSLTNRTANHVLRFVFCFSCLLRNGNSGDLIIVSNFEQSLNCAVFMTRKVVFVTNSWTKLKFGQICLNFDSTNFAPTILASWFAG